MPKLNYGGYLSIKNTGIALHINRHTEAIEKPVEDKTLTAVNWIQKTQWRINKRVLAVAQRLRDDGLEAAGMPSAVDIPLPSRLSQEEFSALSKSEQRSHMDTMSEIHATNARSVAMRRGVYRMLVMAETLKHFERLWFPHFFDFRGRIYPSPQDLNPQGSGIVKGLLEFAESAPLGDRGLYWMAVGAANCFGHDKLDLDVRYQWTMDNLPMILDIARDPEGMLTHWANDDVDSPWEALALCFEFLDLQEHLESGGLVAEFKGHQPIRMDATCSGIQHLSAMMKDEHSASMVNVLPTGKRADIYSDVCVEANKEVAKRAANGCKLSMEMLGRIKRGDVKQPVMTTPYGVTSRGILDQLASSQAVSKFNSKDRFNAAGVLRDIVVAALEGTIGQPRAAMQYFKDVAAHLYEKGKPLVWTTPAGFTVKQAYYAAAETKVNTLVGVVQLYREDPDAGLVKQRQLAGSAPNVVHSYDAAHLCMVACRMKEQGIRDLSFIHDSFGAHAGNIQALQDAIREEFVALYGGDALEQWRQSVIKHSGVEDIPPVPPLGNLDVSAVLESPFFFS